MGSEPVELLDRPVYSTVQVDRILNLRPGTAERWIDGYTRSGRHYPPVIRIEPTGSDIVTWGELGVRYPLAHAAPWLETRGRELVRRIQDEVSLDRDLQLVVVRNDQLVLALPAEQYVDSIDFGDTTWAQRIRAASDIPDVWFDPLRQFGEPVVRSVPTAIIAEQYRAGDSIGLIAEAYSLSEGEVEQAIRYELRGARQPQAA
jgi:uncharacterized protein (DUF433 family)